MVDIRPSRGPAHYDQTSDRLTIQVSEARTIGFQELSPILSIRRTFTNSLGSIELLNAARLLKGVRDFSKIEIDPKVLRRTRRNLRRARTDLALVERYNPGIIEESRVKFETELAEVTAALPDGADSDWKSKFPSIANDEGLSDLLFNSWLDKSLNKQERDKVLYQMAMDDLKRMQNLHDTHDTI